MQPSPCPLVCRPDARSAMLVCKAFARCLRSLQSKLSLDLDSEDSLATVEGVRSLLDA